MKLVVPNALSKPSEQRGFTNAETSLLLTGLKRYETDWEKIQKWVLPTKKWFRKLTRRDEPNNEIKDWKLNRSKELTEQENDLLKKGVQCYGKRFDLISEKVAFCVILNRTEGELRKAYEKMCKRALSAAAQAENAADASSTLSAKSRKSKRKPEINSHFQEHSPNGKKSRNHVGIDESHLLRKASNAQGSIPSMEQFEHENMSSSDEETAAQDPVLLRNRQLLAEFQSSSSFAEFPQHSETSNLMILPTFEEHYRTRLSLIGDLSAENSSEPFPIRLGTTELQGTMADVTKERGEDDVNTTVIASTSPKR
eukprot:765281-Hanusia_phi.AAC.3